MGLKLVNSINWGLNFPTVINFAFNLGEVNDQPKIVRKILRSLTEDLRPKVTAITESKDVDCGFNPISLTYLKLKNPNQWL